MREGGREGGRDVGREGGRDGGKEGGSQIQKITTCTCLCMGRLLQRFS